MISEQVRALVNAATLAPDSLDAFAKHDICDAAGVVSHTSSGQPLPVDVRLAMAAKVVNETEGANHVA